MNSYLFDAIKNRRSYYAIGNGQILPDNEILSLIEHAVKYAPTAFNSQSARLVVLLKKEHEKLWEFTGDILKPLVPEEAFPSTKKKLDAFENGYGTILYFEDQPTVKSLQDNFPLYSENFPVWSLQSSGMLQYIIWTLLESEGYGASLQHYNPLIDEKVKSEWNIPEGWKLIGQMPFGKPLSDPDQKSFMPLEDRIRVYK